jgi:hypothetical protein
MLVESGEELGAVITIVTLCALIISLFGGYLDPPNDERLTSITKAIFDYLNENSR